MPAVPETTTGASVTHKVLIVDDEKAITELLEDVLEPEPYALISAGSGEEATRLLRVAKRQKQTIDMLEQKYPPKLSDFRVCGRCKAREDSGMRRT